jgi:hypothetical protein
MSIDPRCGVVPHVNHDPEAPAMKHEPASALPLEAVPHRDPDEGDAMAVVYCDTFEHAVQTAAYIEHAANAYPKLVAGLQMMLSAVNQKKLDELVVFATIEKARGLLAELGESE